MVFDAVSRHMGGILSMETFKSRMEMNRSCGKSVDESPPGQTLYLPDELPTLKEIESIVIEEALKRAQGNQTIAAQMIGLTRSALNKRLNRPQKLP
jgi:DNA-binding NtrC family response regulator